MPREFTVPAVLRQIQSRAGSVVTVPIIANPIQDVSRIVARAQDEDLTRQHKLLSRIILPANIEIRRREISSQALYSPVLDDELAQFCNLSTDIRSGGRSTLEIEALSCFSGISVDHMLSTRDQFFNFLNELNAFLNPGNRGFRVGEMSTKLDARGARSRFPDINQGLASADQLRISINENIHARPAATAIAVLVHIMALHLFNDGNGRTARVLYNIFMNYSCSTEGYLPIIDLSMLHPEGYMLKLRRATHGEWQPLIELLKAYYSIELESRLPNKV